MSSLLKHSLVLRLVGGYGAIFILGLVLTGAFSITRVAKLVDSTIDSYGETVSAQLANSSLDAVMQRDMIGLQAHLSRLLKTPGIVSAVIYDARNELMAQAGATPSELSNRDYLHCQPLFCEGYQPAAFCIGANTERFFPGVVGKIETGQYA